MLLSQVRCLIAAAALPPPSPALEGFLLISPSGGALWAAKPSNPPGFQLALLCPLHRVSGSPWDWWLVRGGISKSGAPPRTPPPPPLLRGWHLYAGSWSAERNSTNFWRGAVISTQADIHPGSHIPLRLYIGSYVATPTPYIDTGSPPPHILIDFSV